MGALRLWMISPSIAFLVLVTTIPLISLLIMSFCRIDLTYPLDNGWIGFQNYIKMTEDARFWFSIKLTYAFLITVSLQVIIGLTLAMAFFRGFKGQGFMRVSVLMPMILAPVVVGLAWRER